MPPVVYIKLPSALFGATAVESKPPKTIKKLLLYLSHLSEKSNPTPLATGLTSRPKKQAPENQKETSMHHTVVVSRGRGKATVAHACASRTMPPRQHVGVVNRKFHKPLKFPASSGRALMAHAHGKPGETADCFTASSHRSSRKPAANS